jgi:hypothetical protein
MDGNNYTMLSDYIIEGATVSKLPLLLAGPILRRAEPSQVCIWIACSKAVSIQAEIFRVKADSLEKRKIKNYYNNNDNQPNNTSPIGFGSTKSIRLGENLYIGLVVARPLQPTSSDKITSNFPTDELLAYDIEITYHIDSDPNHCQKKGERLKDLGLLSGKNSIVYSNDYVNSTNNNKKDNGIQLPTFFIRGRKTDIPLNLL